MANQTVYPYGAGGSLPASIGIVNDLTTGGVDKALAAQQGVVIAQKFDEIDFEVNEDGVFFIDSYFRIGAQITSSGLSSINMLTFESL